MDSIQNGYMTSYMEQNMLFARTVVVKLQEAAELINEGLAETYGNDIINVEHPETWKYYLNLSGVYHSTDHKMSVMSIDTLEMIEFTVENLKVHTATAAAYAYDTRSYYALVAAYPQQEMLINGILTPVDINVAIAAENGAILGYPKHLIETNEVSLVRDLEQYIQGQMHRWFNAQFIMSDNLFCAAFFTLLHLFILPKLLNLRLARCKTAEAHSFHVRMYLASHGGLDRFLPYLTLKQALWLYRNICLVERNPGQVKQFYKLLEKIVTERGIPLGEYSIRHLDQFDADYLPIQIARIKILNANVNSLTQDYHSVEALLDKERLKTEGNAKYLNANTEADVARFKTATSAITQTKVLHSSMVDYSNAVPEPFEVVAIRQWCYMAFHDLYDVAVSFKDPKTSETRTLFAKDAFVYLQYVLMSAEGLSFESFPQYLNMQQRIHPLPTPMDLLAMTDYTVRDLSDIAAMILARQPRIAPCFSVSAFYKQVEELTGEAYWHWFLISSMEDMYERAQVENMVKRLYEDVRMDYTLSTTDVSLWLNQNNLPVYDLSKSEAAALATTIYEAATGLTIDSAKMLKNIQKAMLDLMTELSSYSIQLTREINTEDLTLLNWPAIRLGNQKQSQQDHRNIDNGPLVLNASGGSKDSVHIGADSEVITETKMTLSTYKMIAHIDASAVVTSGVGTSSSVEDYGPALSLAISYPGQDEALEEDMGLAGYTSFDRLPESARQKLKSIY